jgi:hypothetical protein
MSVVWELNINFRVVTQHEIWHLPTHLIKHKFIQVSASDGSIVACGIDLRCIVGADTGAVDRPHVGLKQLNTLMSILRKHIP